MRRLRADLDLAGPARLVPAAGVALVWGFLMFRSGGYHPGTWSPAGLVLSALLALAVLGAGRLLPAGTHERRALALLLAFSAWCYLSIAWSDGPGPSWEAANLLLVAVLGAWTLALAPWRTRSAQVLTVALSAAAGGACLVALLSALGATDLTTRFEDFRFSPPLDYPNSSAAFAFMAAIPALLLAARPDASIPAKGLAQGLATFLCSFALLAQSRGSILGGAAAIAVLFWAVPFRWRLFAHGVVLVAAVAATAGAAGDVYTAAIETGRASAALREAFTAILLATGAGAVAGLLLAVAEHRLDSHTDEWAGAARRAAIVLCALAVLGVAGAGVARSAAISDTLGDQWEALKSPGSDFRGDAADEGGNRLTSVDPLERYDYWRVSLDGFASNPLGGMGAGGFEHRYALERRYPKPSRYPHNVALKVLGDTGIVGFGLMAAFLVVVARGLLPGSRRRTTRERVVAATACATLAYFLAHGLFDWLEAYPVLAGPALAFPLVALAVRGHADRQRRASPQGAADAVAAPAGSRLLRVGLPAALVVALCAGTLAAPWLALRYRERAADTWRSDPGGAYEDLDRAASLDPLSSRPLVLQGVIALTRGDGELAREGFEGALEREQEWLPHFGLALLARERGDRETMRRELETALRQHPEDPSLPEVAERLLGEGDVPPAQALRDALVAPGSDLEPIS